MSNKPLECSNCQKKACISYTFLADGKTERHDLCEDCPFLAEKLPKSPENSGEGSTSNISPAHEVICEHCGTTLTSIKRGERLGCQECYQIFSDVIIKELSDEERLPIPFDIPSMKEKNFPLHVGKSPGETQKKGTLSARLETLHLALGEALAFENYEHAAHLRDQIKQLMAQAHDK